jgi:betaine reductase
VASDRLQTSKKGAEETIMDMKGKKVIALGERDGIQGTAIAECARSAGADVVLEMTHCFV